MNDARMNMDMRQTTFPESKHWKLLLGHSAYLRHCLIYMHPEMDSREVCKCKRRKGWAKSGPLIEIEEENWWGSAAFINAWKLPSAILFGALPKYLITPSSHLTLLIIQKSSKI